MTDGENEPTDADLLQVDQAPIARPETDSFPHLSPGLLPRMMADLISVFRSVCYSYPLAVTIAGLLTSSGLLHLVAWLVTGTAWEGPLSLRKPALFGISGGLTVWSIAWVLSRLRPFRFDRLFANSMALGLLLEVGLITGQQWRGQASHFNRSTPLDGAVEAVMLALISFVTAGVLVLALRSIRLPAQPAETRIAIRGGLWLLVVSCGLGFAAHVFGEWNVAAGHSPSILRPAGVLKYPHGAALHAIQWLPLLAWGLRQFRIRSAVSLMIYALTAQILFLAAALWQTIQGRDRFDLDLIGGSLLASAGLLVLAPLITIFFRTPSRIATTIGKQTAGERA